MAPGSITWESDVSRDWNGETGYDHSGVEELTDTMVASLVSIVLIGLIGMVIIGGIYCFRGRCQSRDGYDHVKSDDTDPLLLTPPP